MPCPQPAADCKHSGLPLRAPGKARAAADHRATNKGGGSACIILLGLRVARTVAGMKISQREPVGYRYARERAAHSPLEGGMPGVAASYTLLVLLFSSLPSISVFFPSLIFILFLLHVFFCPPASHSILGSHVLMVEIVAVP